MHRAENQRSDRFAEHYDCVIVGAGLGGLSCALTLSSQKRKVLLVERHNIPGGLATSFVRGRFEFEVALHQMSGIGRETHPGALRKILEREWGLLPEFVRVPEAYRVVSAALNLDLELPFGIEDFVATVEQALPGTGGKVSTYFSLCQEVFEAYAFLGPASEGRADWLFDKFPRFRAFIQKSLAEVALEFEFSPELTEVLQGYWPYLGVPPESLDFTIWAAMFYSYIAFGGYILRRTSHALAAEMHRKVVANGSTVVLNQRVDAIRRLPDNEWEVQVGSHVLRARSVVGNTPQVGFREVGPAPGARRLGASALVVYLGLDADPAELGLANYEYAIALQDSDLVHRGLCEALIRPKALTAICLNRAIPDCSPLGTTILTLMVLVQGNAFDAEVAEDYLETKMAMAEDLISVMSRYLRKDLRSHIEEIEVATPETFNRYTGVPNGTIYGFDQSTKDSSAIRFLTRKPEGAPRGWEYAGGFGEFGHGFASAILSGRLAGSRVGRFLREVGP